MQCPRAPGRPPIPYHSLERFEEARSVLRKTIPVTQRVLGKSNQLTLRMRLIYATVLYNDPSATLDDLHEAVTTLEDTARIARRVLGGAHPLTMTIEKHLLASQAALGSAQAPDAVDASS